MTRVNHTTPKPIWEEKQVSLISYGGTDVTKNKFRNFIMLKVFEVS